MNLNTCYYIDALIGLEQLDNNSIDLICTDPPYGISFMGKDWDKAIPKVEIWQECLRVLKHGAFAFVMSSPRQDVLSRMIIRLEDAGFVIAFTSLYWTYASGFPKAQNISKVVDKKFGVEREVIGKGKAGLGSGKTYAFTDNNKTNGIVDITAPATPQAIALSGSYGGFQPKPALEPIIVAMKPLSEKTFVDQALKNRKGITWLDDGRIPYIDEADKNSAKWGHQTFEGEVSFMPQYKGTGKSNILASSKGRFPANLLVSDDVLDDGVVRKTGDVRPHKRKSVNQVVKYNSDNITGIHNGDEGTFSRYFDLDAWFIENIKRLPESVQKTFPFLIVPKASKGEKNKGLFHLQAIEKEVHMKSGDPIKGETPLMQNIHPTVKPLQLMHYLITLGSREEDIVLDPFIGSGTTALACQQLNRKWIGFEIDIVNKPIIEGRLSQRRISDYV